MTPDFDAVVCQFALMFFPDKDRSYSGGHRVLAREGRYLFSVADAHRSISPVQPNCGWVARRFFPADPPQFYKVPLSCSQIDPIRESIIAAGFTVSLLGINEPS